MEKEIYKIVDKETNKTISVYIPPTSRDVEEFESIEDARTSNCHDIYKDKEKYRIEKYKVTYELIDPDCDK